VNGIVSLASKYPITIATKYAQLEIVSTGALSGTDVSARLNSSWRKEKACFESMSALSIYIQ